MDQSAQEWRESLQLAIPALRTPKQQMIERFVGFLPPIESVKPPFVQSRPKKWPPDNRVKPVIPTKRAFSPLPCESIELIRERFGI